MSLPELSSGLSQAPGPGRTGSLGAWLPSAPGSAARIPPAAGTAELLPHRVVVPRLGPGVT